MAATLEKPKPGLVAALLIPFVIWLVASIVAVIFAVMGFSRAEDVADDLARFPEGQASTIELSSAGDYRIWIDESTADDTFSPSATATITGPGGEDVPVSSYIGSLNYNDLEAVLTFEAPEAGTYTFEATETSSFSDTTGSSAEFAVGKGNPVGEVFKGFLIAAVIGGLGFLIAIIVLIVMLVKRGRSKRRITQASIQSGGYGPPGGYGGPGYGTAGGYGAPGGYPPSGEQPAPGGYPPPGGSSW